MCLEAVSATKKSDLEKLPEVLSAKDTGSNVWFIEVDETTDIRPVIFKFAVDNGLAILTQNYSKRSMEEAFKDLTK